MGRKSEGNGGDESKAPLLSTLANVPTITIKAANTTPPKASPTSPSAKNSIPLTPSLGSSESDSCILVVGTTGTGKTSTVNTYTGSSLQVGEGSQAVTGTTVKVEDGRHPGHACWIDNPGWSDTDGRSDAMVFKELLRYMQNNKKHKVKAVVWKVMPQPRMDSTLQAQAEFIDQFTVGNEKGKIWNNVVILVKGKLSHNQDQDCQGARTAAKNVFVHAQPVSLGYTFATNDMIDGIDEKLRKEKLCMLTDQEIRSTLEVVFEKMPPCVQVVFANQRCQACGQTGDPRLMEDMCHRNKIAGHRPGGKLKQRFSKVQIGVAAGVGIVGVAGICTAAALIPAELALLALPAVMGPGAIMGSHRLLNTATTGPAACPVKITDMRWSCCGAQEMAEGGCTELCDLCGKVWGESEPCVLIRHPDHNMQHNLPNYEVHVKNHDLVDIGVDMTKRTSNIGFPSIVNA